MNLTQIFISLKLDSGGFSVKIRWSSKKKRSSPKFKGFFRPKSEIQGFFSGRILVISKQKKGLHRNSNGFSGRNQKLKGFFWPNAGDLQKKRSPPKFKGFFLPKSEIQRFFWPKSGDLQKIGLHRLWVSSWTKKLHYSGPNKGKFFTTSAPKSLWGAVFIFEAKIGLKSARNVLFCIFFRPMGEARAPSPSPLAIRYRSIVDNSYILTYSIYFVSLSTANKPTTLKLANFVCSWCLGRS